MNFSKNRIKKIEYLVVLFFLIFTHFWGTSIFSSLACLNDKDFYDNEYTLKTHQGSPELVFSSYQIDDDDLGESLGDNDGNVEAGETIELRVSVKNEGQISANNVTGTLKISDDNVNLITNVQSFVSIQSNQIGRSASSFVFTIDSNCSINHKLDFILELSAVNGGPWKVNFDMNISGRAEIEYFSYEVNDEDDGDLVADNDGIVDPGEFISFKIELINDGEADAYDVDSTIKIQDPFIEVKDNSGDYGRINGERGISSGDYKINVSGATPDKHEFTVQMTLTDVQNRIWLIQFVMVVNGTPKYEVYDFNLIELKGNGDEYLDAGESWYPLIIIKNAGHAKGEELMVHLDSSDIYIAFQNQEENGRIVDYGDIGVNARISPSNSSAKEAWTFDISALTPSDYNISFQLIIEDGSGNSKTLSINAINRNGIFSFMTVDMIINFVILFIVLIISVLSLITIYKKRGNLKASIGKIKNKRQEKKEREEQEREKQQNRYDTLLKEANELIKEGEKKFQKDKFDQAKELYESGLEKIKKASKKTSKPDEKAKLERISYSIKENLLSIFIYQSNSLNKEAKKHLSKKEIIKTKECWNLSIEAIKNAITYIRAENLEKNYKDIDQLEKKKKELNRQLEILLIQERCLEAEEIINNAEKIKEQEGISVAITRVVDTLTIYSDALSKAQKIQKSDKLINIIRSKIEKGRHVQEILEEERDQLFKIQVSSPKIMIYDQEDEEIGLILNEEDSSRDKAGIKIVRETEYYGGQIRLLIGIINQTNTTLTDFEIKLELPEALKFMFYEPKELYRIGDSIRLPKVGVGEKKSIAIYLEPIRCMVSPVNALISFHDAQDNLRSISMKKIMVSIICPVFFTEEEANVAKAKSLFRKHSHRDKKIFPIFDSNKTREVYYLVLSAIGIHDLKIIYNEYNNQENTGEAWIYGRTKGKKEILITYVFIDASNKTLEIETSGNLEEQITGFLAELGKDIRKQLRNMNLIPSEEFFDLRMSVFNNKCPYCPAPLTMEQVLKFKDGKSIKCNHCDELILNTY